MQYTATAKYIRMSPRKVRLVADTVRGANAQKAVAMLSGFHKSASKPLVNVLQSALANAKNKQAKPETLTIMSIDVTGGPGLKRWHAVSRGSAHAYKKRMTHIRVVLADTAEGKEK